MDALWGAVLGLGLFMVWWSFWPPPQRRERTRDGWSARTQDHLVRAGAPSVTPAALVGVAAGLGIVTFIVVAGLSDAAPIAACFAVLAARAPFALVSARARARSQATRELWPEVVDSLASGIRAGLALPEAVAQIGDRGPVALREPFALFAEDYRASGRFHDCLDALKGRLADPVADRLVETLRITRDVGGTDVGRVLRTLAEFLRDDARTRGELEARQSWTVNAARLAVAAPWAVLAMLATQGSNAAAYNSPAGVVVLALGGASTVVAYRLMMRVGQLPEEARVLR
ncbi:type II secretion system F family protein [Demequina muriae]|uniref:Type II secretion system F family protein n=1 Tax=Demequina muriae TaxID=3051664 RepID=A0ABT8GF73_9MICO|nr:type II secretion system F family protein [Demequina sp. EGI L300058]MDN4479916.1 type II secretion system F family protein [Demequina sp. EGI L300058]